MKMLVTVSSNSNFYSNTNKIFRHSPLIVFRMLFILFDSFEQTVFHRLRRCDNMIILMLNFCVQHFKVFIVSSENRYIVQLRNCRLL